MIDQLDQIALLGLAGHDGGQAGVAALQHFRAEIQSQPRFLFIFAVAIPATFFENRRDVALEVDLVSPRLERQQKEKNNNRQAALRFQSENDM